MKMLLKRIDPDVFTFTSLIVLSVISNVSCRPKGGRGSRGGSIAVYGGSGGGRFLMASNRWAVLSPATKILVLIFCILLGVFLLLALYRAYVWCKKDNGRR